MRPAAAVGRHLGSAVRVVAAVVALLAAVLTATGIVAVRTLHDELLARVDDRVIDDVRNLALALETDVVEPDQLENIEVAAQGPSTSATALLDEDGGIIYQSPSGSRQDPDPLPRLPSLDELTTRAGSPITVPAEDGSLELRLVAARAGDLTVVAAAPLDELDHTLATLARRLLFIGVVAFAVLSLLIWAVVTAATRRIDHMIDTAARIGAGDLTARVNAPEGPDGSPAGRLGHALDEMLHRLQASFDDRQASEDRVRRFAADASHELRTPLTHVRGYAEILRSGAAGTDTDRARAAERIESEATRMAGLVDDLLLLVRLDQEPQGERTPVDLAQLVSESVTDARTAEPQRPITLEFPTPPRPVVVMGDDARLRQIVANLLANVRAHTPPATPVTVRLDTPGAGVARLTVADDGPGMAPETAARAFERFSRGEDARTRPPGNHGGSGLGLAIVAAIVDAHGGTIHLDTAPGAGTRVTVDLLLPTPTRGSIGPVR
jgi:two-component system OmpR family sensor kinase